MNSAVAETPASPVPKSVPVVNGKRLSVSGRFPRIARMHGEYHDTLPNPEEFVAVARAAARADIFSFVQPVWDCHPRYPYHLEWDEKAVLQFETYESWWKSQLKDKTRNMVRKAAKKGIEIRVCECDEKFLRGIKEIYDESPVRQGKPFKHYGKDLATLRDAHLTFAESSQFIGAYFEDKLIGFIKMVWQERSATIMQIIAMVKYRDKAPTNALLSKVVEVCSERDIHVISYGTWSRRVIVKSGV